MTRALTAAWRFLYDFLVGDTPELFVAALVVVGCAFALAHETAAAVVAVPGLALAAVVASAVRGRRGAP